MKRDWRKKWEKEIKIREKGTEFFLTKLNLG